MFLPKWRWRLCARPALGRLFPCGAQPVPSPYPYTYLAWHATLICLLNGGGDLEFKDWQLRSNKREALSK